jgi:hypothetical protein
LPRHARSKESCKRLAPTVPRYPERVTVALIVLVVILAIVLGVTVHIGFLGLLLLALLLFFVL